MLIFMQIQNGFSAHQGNWNNTTILSAQNQELLNKNYEYLQY